METHTGSRFARHLDNIPQVTVKGCWKFFRIKRLVSVKVDLSYQKSICKTLRKYSASNYQGSLKMLFNRLDSTQIKQLVSVDVDSSHRRSICKTLRKYSASNCKGLLKMLSNQTTRLSQSRPVLPEVDLQDTCKSASNYQGSLKMLSDLIRLESNDSSQLMSTRHTGSRFARHL